jgi:hypothetical protein
MFKSISATIPADSDLPDRSRVLDLRQRVLMGTFYDGLNYEFHQEKNGAGEYVPLVSRQPSIRYGLCRLVVDETVAMLFGESRFPDLDCEDEDTRNNLALIEDECGLVRAMREAALFGSCGSVCVLMRVLGKRPYFDVMQTLFLTPTWQKNAPDQLESVRERYKVRGQAMADAGYSIKSSDLQAWFWFQRIWDMQTESWFLPLKVSDLKRGKSFLLDTARTVEHRFGFVPMVWIRNLPGGDQVDGDCTFRAAIETSIEIDYQLSQAGRGLKYSSDPTLMIKEPAFGDGQFVKSAANALLVSEKGDAKLLEIGGTAAAAVIEYVRVLREMALESVHGNRANADKLSAAQSGRAMELMNQPMINLVDQLRDAYGTNGLLPLLRMVVAASALYPMALHGDALPLASGVRVALKWPPYFSPTQADRQGEATTLTTLVTGGILSKEDAVKQVCETMDIPDAQAAMARIKADEAAVDARLAEQPAVATQAKETVES